MSLNEKKMPATELTLQQNCGREKIMFDSLKHDEHKLGFGKPHKEAIAKPFLKKADSLASALGRRGFERLDWTLCDNRIRYSLITGTPVIDKLPGLRHLFSKEDPYQLLKNIVESRELSFYNEHKGFPFTSLKHHILLVNAFAINFQEGLKFSDLRINIGEQDDPVETQIGSCWVAESNSAAVFRRHMLSPHKGGKTPGTKATYQQADFWPKKYAIWISGDYEGTYTGKVLPDFNRSWENLSGYDLRLVQRDWFVRGVRSWSASLATLEEENLY